MKPSEHQTRKYMGQTRKYMGQSRKSSCFSRFGHARLGARSAQESMHQKPRVVNPALGFGSVENRTTLL
jgi:hypothetical protein